MEYRKVIKTPSLGSGRILRAAGLYRLCGSDSETWGVAAVFILD